MQRRRLLAVAAALAAASGCSPRNGEAPPAGSAPSSSVPASPDGAREAVEAYVQALNSRSSGGLISVGGVKDEKWSRQEAEQILADRGGQGWKIKDVQIQYDMGPDVGSARFLAEDETGKPLRDAFTVVREKDTWHLVIFTDQPAVPGKESSSTEKPHF
ncbi:hypothetical protein ACFWOL_07735 [Streptomyces sp. NPDC058442]|uniref:hypothetical protein n=1 Tax=Streptomyces sp. NPDC058442 TaxID=3346503 RepID=UPI003666F528